MTTRRLILSLTALFVGLRLAGLVAWSWLWVLSPLWIGGAFVIVLAAYIAALRVALGLDCEAS